MSRLTVIHDEADASCRALAARHEGRLQCGRGCHDCCVDGIALLPVEAERIRARNADLLAHGEPHPEGACAFLDDTGSCRIYPDRPLVCRTEGLPLRWFTTAADGSIVEARDICPLNEDGPPLTELDSDDCWLLGPFEGRIAELQSARDPDAARVPLRSLFTRPPAR